MAAAAARRAPKSAVEEVAAEIGLEVPVDDGLVQEVGLQAAVYAGGCKVPGVVAHAQGRQCRTGAGDLDLSGPCDDMPWENFVPLAGLPKQDRRPRAFAAGPEGDETFGP